MNLLYLIRDLWQRKDLQEWVNCRYKEPRTVILDKQELSYIVLNNGLKFYVGPDIHSATSVYWRYHVGMIRKDDRVLDLGANVGGFALAASQRTEMQVVAVEPVLYDWLKENINLNNSSVLAIHGAITGGNKRRTTITWRNMSSVVDTINIDDLIDTHGITFVKMDIEGAEWDIDPESLYGMNHIDGQLHYKNKAHMRSRPPLVKLLEDNYNVCWQPTHPPDSRACLPMYAHEPLNPIFHAYKK